MVIFSTILGPQSVTILQVRLGTQLASEIDGSELRGVRGLAFSVPITPGTYNLTVVATDTRNCVQSTTAIRPVTVQ